MSRERAVASCAGRAWLFTSTNLQDHKLAKADCADCPVIEACRATVRDIQAGPHQSGLHGTWAGQLYGRGMRKKESA